MHLKEDVRASEVDLQNDTLAYPPHTSHRSFLNSRFGNYSLAVTADGRSYERLPNVHKSYNETMPQSF